MHMRPFLLSGRSPSASVPQGSFWWICVGRLVLLVSPVPSEAVASLWRRASQGCLVPGCLGPLKAASPLCCLLSGRPGPLEAAVRSWRRAPQVSLAAGRRVPLNVLVSPWWQPPQGYLAPGRLGVLKTAEAPWRRATSDRLGQDGGGGINVVASTTRSEEHTSEL